MADDSQASNKCRKRVSQPLLKKERCLNGSESETGSWCEVPGDLGGHRRQRQPDGEGDRRRRAEGTQPRSQRSLGRRRLGRCHLGGCGRGGGGGRGGRGRQGRGWRRRRGGPSPCAAGRGRPRAGRGRRLLITLAAAAAAGGSVAECAGARAIRRATRCVPFRPPLLPACKRVGAASLARAINLRERAGESSNARVTQRAKSCATPQLLAAQIRPRDTGATFEAAAAPLNQRNRSAHLHCCHRQQ